MREEYKHFDAWEALGNGEDPNQVYLRGPHITLDKLREEDVSALMEIEIVSFPAPWSESTYRAEANNRLARYGVIRRLPDAGAIPPLLAYGGLWDQPFVAHITTIASHPDFRGRRLGEAMLVFLLQLAVRTLPETTTAVTLEVRPSNTKAINLYRKWGFEEVGRRKHYYRDNWEDALLYTLEGIREPEFALSVDQWLDHLVQNIKI